MIGRGLVSICIACWLSALCRIDGFVLPPSLNYCIISTTQPHPSTLTSLGASTSSTYDIIVIGGGSAGLTAAKFAATFGKSVCLVESNKVGGDWKVCTS